MASHPCLLGVFAARTTLIAGPESFAGRATRGSGGLAAAATRWARSVAARNQKQQLSHSWFNCPD